MMPLLKGFYTLRIEYADKKEDYKLSLTSCMKGNPPFDFIFDYLPGDIIVRWLFGMHYIYYNKKNILILRDAAKEPELNGIWIATVQAHHKSLTADLPGVISILANNPKKKDSAWMYIRETNDHFEKTAIHLCELITRRDPRIGVVTKKSLSF